MWNWLPSSSSMGIIHPRRQAASILKMLCCGFQGRLLCKCVIPLWSTEVIHFPWSAGELEMHTQPSICEVHKHSWLLITSTLVHSCTAQNHIKMLMVLKSGSCSWNSLPLFACTGNSKCYQQVTILGHIIMSLDRKWHLYAGELSAQAGW